MTFHLRAPRKIEHWARIIILQGMQIYLYRLKEYLMFFCANISLCVDNNPMHNMNSEINLELTLERNKNLRCFVFFLSVM